VVSDREQTFVTRPKRCAQCHSNGNQQMSVYVANAESEQFVAIDELQDLTIREGLCLGHLPQLGQHGVALPKIA